ncbi:MAG: hypothetical protein JRI42_07120 [Deltaproteobacteria bacterium]|nr:hypothetical protein [Deltaproteobacteria bacterium]
MKIEYLAENLALVPIIAHWHHEEWGYFNPGDSVEKRITNLQTHLGREQIPTTFISLSGGILLGSASLIAHDMDTRMDLSPWLARVRHRDTVLIYSRQRRVLCQPRLVRC